MCTRYVFFLLFIFLMGNISPQNLPKTEQDYCVSDTDYKLYMEINKYRESRGLNKINLSLSLCYTAYLHAFDLYHNWESGTNCNMHSWSGQVGGPAFCYPTDQDDRRKKNVWNKAREITAFPALAYELVYQDDLLKTDVLIALDMWGSTVAGRDYLLNEDKWKDKEWQSIGVAVYNNYVSVFLSNAKDPKGSPTLCKDINDKIVDMPLNSSSVSNITPKQSPPSAKSESTNKLSIGVQEEGVYYIVGTSTDDIKYAERMYNSFVREGYNDAKIIKSGNKYRVSMAECKTQEEANKARLRCSKTVKDCWILK